MCEHSTGGNGGGEPLSPPKVWNSSYTGARAAADYKQWTDMSYAVSTIEQYQLNYTMIASSDNIII